MITIHIPLWLMWLLASTLGVMIGRLILDLTYAAYRKRKKQKKS